MQIRIDRRKKIAQEQPVRLRMFNEAKKYEGIKESPFGSNQVLFSRWYGMVGPWCAMYASYVGVKVGSVAFSRAHRWAYVPYLVNDARSGRYSIAVTYNPQQGDLVTYDWERNGIPDHVGFFDTWLDSTHTTFRALEGNTGLGSDSNGGEVMYRNRNKSSVTCFIHVGA
jgi:hypothetical protein